MSILEPCRQAIVELLRPHASALFFRDIPEALTEAARRDEVLGEVPPSAAAKVLLLNAMVESGVRPAELARRLGVSRQEVHRLTDLRHFVNQDSEFETDGLLQEAERIPKEGECFDDFRFVRSIRAVEGRMGSTLRRKLRISGRRSTCCFSILQPCPGVRAP